MSALAARLLRRPTTTHHNPVFYRDRVESLLADDPDRLERLRTDPESIELLTWNVFASLASHRDRDWLAHRLQAFGGNGVRAPLRLALWVGRTREPRLEPSAAYVSAIRQRVTDAGEDPAAVASLTEPIEVPVRIESPEVVCLVDTNLAGYRRGSGGRDRLVELVDAGLEHARRINKRLAVATVYTSGTEGARQVSARMNALRENLSAELAHRQDRPEVVLREVPWQQLLTVWEQETAYLDLGGQPVRAFLDHTAGMGLR